MATIWTDTSKASGDTYTKVAKPSPDVVTSVVSYTGGEPYGFLVAITQSQEVISSVVTGVWTEQPKATGDVWTNIAKAT